MRFKCSCAITDRAVRSALLTRAVRRLCKSVVKSILHTILVVKLKHFRAASRGSSWSGLDLVEFAFTALQAPSALPSHPFPPSPSTRLQPVMLTCGPIFGSKVYGRPSLSTNSPHNSRRALAALSCHFSASAFDQASPPNVDGRVGAVRSLAALSSLVMSAGGVADVSSESWAGEVLDSLLDTWMQLLEPPSKQNSYDVAPRSAVDSAGEVFGAYVGAGIAHAAATAHDEDDSSERVLAATAARDERLAAAAGLARVNPGFAVPMLTQLFAERRGRLQALVQVGGDPTETWEELYWLLLLMGHVMADGGDGEVPQVPQSLLELSVSYATDVDRDPVTNLSRAVLEFACVSLSAEGRNSLLSPRLMEALVWFLARWAGTYLMQHRTGRPENGLAGQVRQDQNGANGENGHHLVSEAEAHPALDRAFGEQSGGASTLEALLRISIVSLLEWPGEKDLHAMVCQKLLPSLTRRRTVCRHLVKVGPWQELAQAFASLTPPLSALETSLQRSMAESLCRAAVGFDDKDTAAHYIDSIIGPVVKRVGELAGSPELKDVAQRPDVQLLVGALLERLRGAARGSVTRIQPPLLALGVASFDPMLVLLQVGIQRLAESAGRWIQLGGVFTVQLFGM
jgi:hypothetical protein